MLPEQPEAPKPRKDSADVQQNANNDLDMHSSKDAHESQGGQSGRSTDTDKNSEHDKGAERSIANREDS